MDKVTQQNAANSEESGAAAEEMNAQAQQMKSSVEDLQAIVGNTVKNKRSKTFRIHCRPGLLLSRQLRRNIDVTPNKVIPMDDDFTDF